MLKVSGALLVVGATNLQKDLINKIPNNKQREAHTSRFFYSVAKLLLYSELVAECHHY